MVAAIPTITSSLNTINNTNSAKATNATTPPSNSTAPPPPPPPPPSLPATALNLLVVLPLVVPVVLILINFMDRDDGYDYRHYRERMGVEYQSHVIPERDPEAEARATQWLRDLVGDERWQQWEEDKTILIRPDNLLSPYMMLIDRAGHFKIIDGDPKQGYLVRQGYASGDGNYLRDDVLASVIRWFRYDPDRVIKHLHCGKIRIVEEGHEWA